jgi:hypothetical protein
MINYIIVKKLVIISILSSAFILSSLVNTHELSAQRIQSNGNLTNNNDVSRINNTDTSKPVVSLWIPCMAAQGYLPGEFKATGFTQDSEVVLEINKNNSIALPPSEPVTLVVKADSTGTVKGNFVLDRQTNEDYFLHLYSFDGSPEYYFYGGKVPQKSASTLIGNC